MTWKGHFLKCMALQWWNPQLCDGFKKLWKDCWRVCWGFTRAAASVACPTSKTNQILVNKRFLSPTMIHILPNGLANISQLPLWNGPPIKLKNSTIHQKLDDLWFRTTNPPTELNNPPSNHKSSIFSSSKMMTISIRPIRRLGVGVCRAPGSPCRGEHQWPWWPSCRWQCTIHCPLTIH